MDMQRWTTMPDGSLSIVRCVQSPQQAGISFFYRELTALDFVSVAVANSNYTVDAALYDWYVRRDGWDAAQWYSRRFILVSPR